MVADESGFRRVIRQSGGPVGLGESAFPASFQVAKNEPRPVCLWQPGRFIFRTATGVPLVFSNHAIPWMADPAAVMKKEVESCRLRVERFNPGSLHDFRPSPAGGVLPGSR